MGGASVLLGGLLAFTVANPTGPGAAFWRPGAVLALAKSPVALDVNRTTVPRGGTVDVRVTARGRAAAELWIRAPGESWQRRALSLDTAGTAAVVLGPLESDRYLKAVSGRRFSSTVHVAVSLPALIAALDLRASFPRYLDRPDDVLTADGDTVRLPVGTTVHTDGRLTIPLERARWVSTRAATALATDQGRFTGRFVVQTSAHWRLLLDPEGGGALSEAPPELTIVAVRDSAPVVSVPVPGADTTAPLSLQQALLVDARDDHRVTAVEIVSWRVSRLGYPSDTVVEQVSVEEGGAGQALLHTVLDLNDRGFLPGDTAYFHVRAFDNAPTPQLGVSPHYRLRLRSMAELRRAMRDASRAVGAGADSLVAEQESLARRIEDLAAERERSSEPAGGSAEQGDRLPFESAERARELLDAERTVAERAEALGDQVRQLAEAAWEAGITDPEFHQQLRDIQDLLRRALTDELMERLAALQRAVDRLDATDVRDALRELAGTAQQLREELERGRELFERAAVEGELTTLSSDADDLAQKQRDWNVAASERVDSAAATREDELSNRASELADRLSELERMLDSTGFPPDSVSSAEARALEASQAMDRAASGARQGDTNRARESGAEASDALDPLGRSLRQERDRLREQWREEVLSEMDRALVEAVELAKAQEEVEARLDRGESGGDVRGDQAAIREGVDRVIDRMQRAAGKNALVSPQLGAALGLARHRMDQALEQLQRSSPNTRDAGAAAAEALDALNHVVYAMVRGRDEVAGAASGSGLAEAMERMAELASQQGQLNGQAAGLLPMMEAGGAQLMQELQALAARQQALARELEQLRAGGELSGAGEMADEADEIAQELEGGRLDRGVLERQEQLFRRLLDAGRTLESDEDDERRERVAESARPGNVRVPAGVDVPEGAPRFRYPSWAELRTLSPEKRRLILEYFRRLNEPRR
jgi:hypothetical protein